MTQSETSIDIGTLEALLEPLVSELNAHITREVGSSVSFRPPGAPNVAVTYEGHQATPFGYEFVRFTLEKAGEFRIHLMIEGSPGELSFAIVHPDVRIEGDCKAAEAWLLGLPGYGQ